MNTNAFLTCFFVNQSNQILYKSASADTLPGNKKLAVDSVYK